MTSAPVRRPHRIALSLLARLLLGAAGALPAHADEAALYEAAKKEGEVTWYVAHFSTEVAEAIGRKFDERWPGVKANVVRSTAQVAFQKLSQDMKAGVPVCDVFSSTDTGHDAYLKEKGLLLQWTPENVSKVEPAFRNLDPDGYYHVTAAGLVVITYNKDKVKPADVPTNWTDLLDPKWKDQVSTGHPGYSGYVGTWAVLMRKLYGEDFFTKLEKNKPQIGRSINDTVTMLNSGERSVAFGPSNTTSTAIARGNPLAIVYPKDGSLLMISPSAIPKNSKHPNAAKLFMEFLLGVEASKVLVEYQQESLRSDVPPAPGGKPLSEVKLIRPTEAEIQKGIPEIKELWRDVFGN